MIDAVVDAVNEPPVLDTHAWIWWMHEDRRLGSKTLEALNALPDDRLPYVCDISLWEVAMLVERGRITLNQPLGEWLEHAAHPRTVRVIPIMPSVAAELANLPSTFHRDPADRLIVATCRVLEVPLLTYDRLITESGLVKRWTK